MKVITWIFLALSAPAWAQKHELAFTLGGTTSDLRNTLGATVSGGKSLQFDYGYRLAGNHVVAVSAEVHLLANPLREVAGASSLTRDFASLYLIPGVRVKLNPNGRIQPFGSIGAGYALYEQSTMTVGGAPNSAPRTINRGAFAFGGGVDIKVLPWLAVRGDLRDFYTGGPVLTLATRNGQQHNIVASGGVVLRFGK